MFFSSFVSLFVIADPVGSATVFSALTSDVKHRDQKNIAIKACLIATGLLIFFGLVGKILLEQLGISLDAFRIAGGILLFFTAFRMIMGAHDSDSIQSDEACYKDLSNLSVFPLAIPMLAGPGCMTAVILNMAATESVGDKLEIYLAIIVVEALALFCMLSAAKIVSFVGNTGSSIISRLMGILLAALSVQFIVDGSLSIVDYM